jgi:hypothetical protein
MRFLPLILLLLFSCTTSKSELNGIWFLRQHDYYDKTGKKALTQGEQPFQTWEFSESGLLIDGFPETYDLRNDSLFVQVKNQYYVFVIKEISETSMLLQSNDFTPADYSFYYFLK